MNKIHILKSEYHILLENLMKHGDENCRPQIRIINQILDELNNCKDEKDLEKICKLNDALYPARGGLSEFYIWHSDYDKRMLLNEPLDKAKDTIWSILHQEME